MVVVVAEVVRVHTVVKVTTRHRRSRQASIHAGLVECQGIHRSKHTDIGQDGGVILGVAVAVGRHIHDERDVELRTTRHNSLGVLGHTAVEHCGGLLVHEANGVEVTSTQATTTADTLHGVNLHLAALLVKYKSVVCALRQAQLTATATLLADAGLTTAVLLGLTRARATAHTNILNSAAKACHLVTLEVAEADENVGIHHSTANLCRLDILAALDGYLHIVRTLQAVANDDRTANGHRREAILPSAVEVLDGVLAAAGVQRIAVRQEGHAAQLADHVGHGLDVVGAQVGAVAQLPKVHLDGYELALKIDPLNARRAYQLLQLLAKADADAGPEIGEENL